MAQQTYTEPTWGTSPQPTFCAPSYLHAFGATPFIMLGVVTNLLRYQFQYADNIMSTYLKHLLWTSDKSTTKITIIPGQDVDLEVVNPGPRLHVILDPLKTARVGLLAGDSMPVVPNSYGYVGRRTYNKYVSSGAHVVCVSPQEIEAQLLGEEVFQRMLIYAHKIQEDIGVGMFKVDALYPPRRKDLPEKGVKVFFSTVQVNWESMYKWDLVAEAPTIKRLYQQHTAKI